MPQNLMAYWTDAASAPLKAFMDAAPVSMHAVDSDGVILAVSDFWAGFLGYAPDELVGRQSLDLLEGSSKQRALDFIRPQLEREGQGQNIEVEFLKRSGEIVPVLMSSRRIVDDDGKHILTLSVFFDNRLAKEAQLQLERSAKAADNANRAKSRFLAALSHEIRTPMNAIMGFAQLLKLSNLDERRKRHVDAILNAGGNLMDLLTDLLDLSRIEEGAMRIDKRRFELVSLIDETTDWWHSSAQNKGLRLSVTMDRGLPRYIVTDPVRLQQVLNNLLGNAVKFTEAGSVSLSVAEVSRSERSSRIRFEIADTGPGMRADQVEQLFHPFVQIEPDFAQKPGGWGLGLSICANIASQMAADIGARSTPGEGSVFHFEAGFEHGEAVRRTPSKAMPKKGASAPVKALDILLAEDNQLNQEVMSELLTGMGHAVTIAGNGFEAVQEGLKKRFDVILMDIMMPGLDGIQASEQIRNDSDLNAATPFIACSAHITDDINIRFEHAGITSFLAKPVDPGALVSAIASALGTTSKCRDAD